MPHNANPSGSAVDSPVQKSIVADVSYRDRLQHWAIIRLLPNMQRITVARFRKRSDADGHLRFLQQHITQATFLVVFDPVELALEE